MHPIVKARRRLWAALLSMGLLCVLNIVFAAAPKRDTPHLVRCAATATEREEELEIWKRLTATLGLEQRRDRSNVLVARMIARPAFFSEWVVSVYLPETGPAIIEAAVADQSIYSANHTRKRDVVVLRDRPAVVSVSHFTAALPRDVAEKVGGAWMALVHSAQIPTVQGWDVYDGTLYTFYRWAQGVGDICGEVDEPAEGSPPSRLVGLGRDLLSLARASAEQNPEILTRIREGAERLSSLQEQ